MGVEGLQNFLVKQGIINPTTKSKEIDIGQVDHMFYDFNGIIYSIGSSKIHSILNIERILNQDISKFNPKETLFFALDGSAPLSKIPIQKENRFRRNSGIIEKLRYFANKKKEEEEKLNKDDDKSLIDYVDDKILNSFKLDHRSSISPGTTFMGQIKSFLYYYITKQIPGSFTKNVYISGSDRYGEGEWKIFEHLNNSKYNINDKILIHSSDSDLIIASILSKFENIYLFNGSEIIDIKKIKEKIFQFTNPKDEKEKRQVLIDFSVLSIFCGCDHFPKISFFDLTKAWETYISIDGDNRKLYDFEKKEINLKVANLIFKNLKIKNHKDAELYEVVSQIYQSFSDGKLFRVFDNSIYLDDELVHKDESNQLAISNFFNRDHPFWKNYEELLDKQIYNDTDKQSKVYKILNYIKHFNEISNLKKSNQFKEPIQYEPSISLINKAIDWNLNYFLGECQNFSICLPFSKISHQIFLNDTEQSSIENQQNETKLNDFWQVNDNKKPLSPLLYGFLIMDYPSKSFFPEFIHQLYNNFPNFFGFNIKEMEKGFYKKNSITEIKNQFNKLLENKKLESYQLSQIFSQPTIKFQFNPIHKENQLINVYHESQNKPNHYQFIKSFSSLSGLDHSKFILSQNVINCLNYPNTNHFINNKFKTFKFNNNNNNNNNKNNINININNNNNNNNNIKLNNSIELNKSLNQQQSYQSHIRTFSTKNSISSIFNNNSLLIYKSKNILNILKKL